MNATEAKEEIKRRATDYLQRDGSGKGYVCPICGSGSGPHGTGITTKDGEHFTCWAGCFTSADLIDIIGLEKLGIPADDSRRYPEKLQAAAAELGIFLQEDTKPVRNRATAAEDFSQEPEDDLRAESRSSSPQPAADGFNRQKTTETAKNEPAADYTEFFREAAQHITETEYLQRRGLSLATARRFNIGYCESWRHPKAPRAPATPRLIIPTSAESYLARDTRQEIPEEQQPYTKSKAGAVHIFNAEALTAAEAPLFIVEGEIDAMSIYEAGAEAVALGSTTNIKKLLAMTSSTKPAQPLILSLDNDDAGRKAEAQLAEGLQQQGVTFYRLNAAGAYKDANERLLKDRSGLESLLTHTRDEAHLAQYVRTLKASEYRNRNSAAAHLQEFIDGIADSVNTPALSTGFPKLDAALDGGLYPGLYTLGAISSLGKTTLCLQIADNIAAAGKDVLIISLEMARSELMAKSISRHTVQLAIPTGSTRNAKTTRGITDGKRWANYSNAEKLLIKNAIEEYQEAARHIYILEGIGNIGTAEIRQAMQDHLDATDNVPFLMIDYLQILAPADVRSSDKQNTDKAVLELKRISRDFNTPVLAISSLNRENYSSRINMTAFKESGAIEYSADCLIGLQYAGAGKKDFDADAAATENPRKIEAVILKQRNAAKGATIPLDYYPMFNYYTEGAT